MAKTATKTTKPTTKRPHEGEGQGDRARSDLARVRGRARRPGLDEARGHVARLRPGAQGHQPRQGAVPAPRRRRRARADQARPHRLLRAHRAGDAAAPRRSAAQPAALPERRRRAGLLAEGHPAVVAQVAHDLARDRLPRARGPGRERPPRRGPRGGPVLAGQPGVVRDPRLDVHAAGAVDADLRAHRHRPRHQDHLGRDARAREASTGPPSSTSASARIPSSPAAAASRPGSRSSAAATSTPTRRAWVEKLSRAIGATVPDLVSWEWAKAERGGKARLDYTQNAAIKTLVAPYAVRPRPGAPVSAPIRWEELDDPTLAPDRWTIRDAARRASPRSATCRRASRRTTRSCRRSSPVRTACGIPRNAALRAGPRSARRPVARTDDARGSAAAAIGCPASSPARPAPMLSAAARDLAGRSPRLEPGTGSRRPPQGGCAMRKPILLLAAVALGTRPPARASATSGLGGATPPRTTTWRRSRRTTRTSRSSRRRRPTTA